MEEETCSDTNMDQEDDINWMESVSAIDFDRGLLYFCDEKYSTVLCPTGESVRDLATTFSSILPQGTLYSITGYNPMNKKRGKWENLQANSQLLKELNSLIPGCIIKNNFSFFVNNKSFFERGFTVIIPADHPVKNHHSIIHNLGLKYEQAAYFKCQILGNGRVIQSVVLLEDNGRVEDERLVVIPRPSCHPAYLHRDNNAVFHCLTDVMAAFLQCRHIQGVDELVSMTKYLIEKQSSHRQALTPRHPIIAVEGLDDPDESKKSRQICKLLGAKYIKSPPDSIRHLKSTIQQQDQLLKAAYYSLGNYLLAYDLQGQLHDGPVLIDRYWHSTAAFTIVSEVGRGVSNLPPKDNHVYDWPEDLLSPDAVVFLASRKQCRARKGSSELPPNMVFETYKRMKGPSWIQVNSAGSHQSVAMFAVDELQKNRVVQPSNLTTLCPSQGKSTSPAVSMQPQPDDPKSSDLVDKMNSCSFVDTEQSPEYSIDLCPSMGGYTNSKYRKNANSVYSKLDRSAFSWKCVAKPKKRNEP